MNASKYIKTAKYRKWLSQFFDSVEAGRLRRGCALYESDAVSIFRETSSGGFYAEVFGSRGNVYEVRDYVGLDPLDGRPDEDWNIECSCPDIYVMCKHAICTVIYWAAMMDERHAADFSDQQPVPTRTFNTDLQFAWKLPKNEQALQAKQPFAQLQSQQLLLAKQAQANHHPTLPTLPDAHFWPFNEKLPRIMGKWHDTVVKSLKNMSKS